MRAEDLPLRPYVNFTSDLVDLQLKISERFEDLSSILIISAESLTVSGPIYFESQIQVQGRVVVKAEQESPCVIPRGTILKNTVFACK